MAEPFPWPNLSVGWVRDEWPAELAASGEPPPRHKETRGRAGPPERGGQGQETRAERAERRKEIEMIENCHN